MLQFECTSGLPNGFAPTNLVYSYVFVQTHKLTKEVGYEDILTLQRGEEFEYTDLTYFTAT